MKTHARNHPSLINFSIRGALKRAVAVLLLSLFALGTAPAQDPTAGTFTRTADMTSPRERHTATLLTGPDGKVLVAGGNTSVGQDPSTGQDPTNTAELFDPKASPPTFTQLSPMTVPRSEHTATLLADADGNVLLAGGTTAAGLVTNTAELFNPVLGVFRPVLPMFTQRTGHTATRLPDGKVLVAGGDTGSEPGDTGQLFSPNGPNTAQRPQYYHRPTDNTEQFDPTSESFSELPDMNVERAGHTATLIMGADGKQKVLLAGGTINSERAVTASCELFDPETETFTVYVPMLIERTGHTATLLQNGKVLIVGGTTTAGLITNTAELFDPTLGLFIPVLPGMLELRGRSDHAAALLPDGRVLIAGGNTLTGPTDTGELFDPTLGIFLPLLPKPPSLENTMEVPRYYHRPTLVVMAPFGPELGGPGVLITGGITKSGDELAVTASAEVFTPEKSTVEGACPEGRHGHAMALNPARNTAVLFGGAHSSRLLSDTWEWNRTTWTQINAYVFNEPLNTYITGGPTVRPGLAMAETPASGVNLLVGTNVFTGAFETWEFDGATAVWTKVFTSSASTHPQARASYALAFDRTRNVVVLFGGGDLTIPFQSLDTWEWNPTTKTWSGPFAGPPSRTGHAMAFDGFEVVLFGGEDATGVFKADTWGWWTGTAWEPLQPNGGLPSPRSGHAMVGRRASADGGNPDAHLFGGETDSGVTDDTTWVFTRALHGTWSPLGGFDPPLPSARYRHAMSVDTSNNIVLFGGLDSDGNDLADTWVSDGGGWTQADCGPPPLLTGIVSRKTHGSSDFEIDLPLTGNPGIECRSGGVDRDYTVVFTFAETLTSVGGARVFSDYSGWITTSGIDSSDAHRYVVNLTWVSNAQVITLRLFNVNDSAGNIASTVSVSVGFLLGDTNNDGSVNSSDISQTKSKSGQTISASNFRQDVTVSGAINSSDIGLVKSKSGTALP